MNILIADDNATNRKLLRMTLEAEGHRIHEAADGLEVVEMLEREPAEALISDILMPRMDGYQLCSQLRRSERFRNLPIIIYTGTYTSQADEKLAEQIGADKYIRKPAPSRVLLAAIADCCDEKAGENRRAQPLPEEFARLREYSAVLVSKLEKRNDELEEAQRRLACVNEQLEERVQRRTAQMEESCQELEAFSHSVSHDLRAPLRHIQGYTALLEESAAGRLDAKSQGYLKTISDSSAQMGILIDHLLKFSQMSLAELNAIRVELNSIVQEAIKELAFETQGRNITWQIAPLPEVKADPILLRHVWVNLISNAVKYTRGRDPAKIQIGTMVCSKGELLFYIRDNGVGFDMQYADNLFGVFHRLHRADEFEGAGIGLANVRRIVSRHGGRAWAESKLDVGSTFYFTLPENAEATLPSESIKN